jgi:hypothetical protein
MEDVKNCETDRFYENEESKINSTVSQSVHVDVMSNTEKICSDLNNIEKEAIRAKAQLKMKEETASLNRLTKEKEKVTKTLEFAPEPFYMNESKKYGAFTVGNKYPVLQTTENDANDPLRYASLSIRSSHKIKTKDDNGKICWMDEKYFIPGEIKLTYSEAVGGFDLPKNNMIDETEYYVPEIRGVDKKSDSAKEEIKEDIKTISQQLAELKVLSGLLESENIPEDWDDEGEPVVKKNSKRKMSYNEDESWKYKPFYRTVKSPKPCAFGRTSNINEGKVVDDGNELIENADKCAAAISRVFGGNVADPDNILSAVQELIPEHVVIWEEGKCLSIDGAITKISYQDVQTAYAGLKVIVSDKTAENVVSKLIASKLKKLF